MKNIHQVFKAFLAGFVILMMLPTQVLASDPVAVVESTANQMIAQLKAHKTTIKQNPSYVYSLAYRLVVPRADIAEMSRRVLPPRVWNSATPAQKAQFEKEFTKTLVRTYASALAEYTDQTIHFYPLRGGEGSGTVKVDSQIERTDGPSIKVSYRLINTGSGWKLYDLIVEGVSLIESFRSQFADQVSGSGNIATLINSMQNHNQANGG